MIFHFSKTSETATATVLRINTQFPWKLSSRITDMIVEEHVKNRLKLIIILQNKDEFSSPGLLT